MAADTGVDLAGRRDPVLWCAGLAVLLLAVTVGVVAPGLPARPARWVTDLVEIGAACSAAVGCALACTRTRGRDRSAWGALALAGSCWAAGQTAWSVYELLLDVPAPFPSVADLGYLAFPLAAAVGLALLPVGTPGQGGRRLLDGLLVSVSVLLLSWETALGAVLRASSESDLGTLVALAYPVGDVALISMALLALARGGRHRGALALSAAGLTAIAVADSLFAYQNALGSYATGGAADLGWCFGFGLLGLAGLVRARTESAAQAPDRGAPSAPPRLTGAASMLPYLPLVVVGCLLVGTQVTGGTADRLSSVGFVLLVCLVLGRQYVTVRENRELAQTVARRESQLRHQAFHDALTGLANRALFTDQLARALERQRRSAAPVAVVFVDLDGFKDVNDTLGHGAGDDLLVQVAARLRDALRPGDTLARFGGDEFAALLEDCPAPGEVAARVVESLRAPFALDGVPTAVSGSAGLAVAGPGDSLDVSEVMRRADVAMYAVKRAGRNGYRTYVSGLWQPPTEVAAAPGSPVVRRADLERALADGLVHPEYSPMVDLRTGEVLGLSASARWVHEGRPVEDGALSLAVLRAGLGDQVKGLLLEAACADAARWRAEAGPAQQSLPLVAVRVGRWDPVARDLQARIGRLLARHDLSADALVLEIDGAGPGDAEEAAQVLATVRELGVRIALTGVGAGSSLAQLARFPVDILSVAHVFAHDLNRDPRRRRVLEGLVVMATHLDLTVVAEGVEQPAQRADLSRLGVALRLPRGPALGLPLGLGRPRRPLGAGLSRDLAGRLPSPRGH